MMRAALCRAVLRFDFGRTGGEAGGGTFLISGGHMGVRGCSMVVALCLLAVAGTARAENPARAKEAYKEGLLQYNLGEYEKALDKFKTAYLELPDPAFLFNIAQCQRQLGQYAAASKSYRAFLRETPNPPPRMRE